MNYQGSTSLSDLSERESTWDRRKASSIQLAELYLDSSFQEYAHRIKHCGDVLAFEIASGDLRLSYTWFCRVRQCPICQWRRSLKWKARAYKAIPTVVEDFPKHRWLFLTLTVKNCPVENLRDTLTLMHTSFKRLTKLKAWCVTGWIKSTEITRGKDGLAHPHFHCLLMVPPSYFSGSKYLSHAKWRQLWQQSLRVGYAPVIDVRAIKRSENPTVLIPEILKYQTKATDLTEDRKWLLELTEQLRKTRSISLGGILCDYMREIEQELEDGIDENTELEQIWQEKLHFVWNHRANKYSLDH